MKPGISVDVEDRHMLDAIGGLALSGFKAANRRAVMKTARLGAVELKAATRMIMGDEPGGYDPYGAQNFRRPRVRTLGSSISAGTGYTQAGSFDRFRSTGTGPRYRGSGVTHIARSGRRVRTRNQGGGYTGIEQGFGMVQMAALQVDPLFPAIAEVELIAELKKLDL